MLGIFPELGNKPLKAAETGLGTQECYEFYGDGMPVQVQACFIDNISLNYTFGG